MISIIRFQVLVWVISASARATLSFASSVLPIVVPAAAAKRLTSCRPSADLITVPSEPLVVPVITPTLGLGVGLSAALFDAARPTTADDDSLVMVPFKSAAMTAGFWAFRFVAPARTPALLYVKRSKIGASGLVDVKKSRVLGEEGVAVGVADVLKA